ncbi:hypothetical protein J6590_066108 [Homalodisca vitripennis]|nr:hypothetical protein J6590_066108 [Homalodisca vitripennis]
MELLTSFVKQIGSGERFVAELRRRYLDRMDDRSKRKGCSLNRSSVNGRVNGILFWEKFS